MAKLSVLLIIIVQKLWAVVFYGEIPLCPEQVGKRCFIDMPYWDSTLGPPSILQYSIDGKPYALEFEDGDYLTISCSMHVTLDNDALPCFTRPITVNSVTLDGCSAPNSSIVVSLKALNVSYFKELTMNMLPSKPQLKKEHFDDLKIYLLKIQAERKVILEPDFLSNLNLTELHLTDVLVEKLPVGLRVLHLENSGIFPLRNEVIKSLHTLNLTDMNVTDISELVHATELKILQLRVSIDELPAMPKLEILVLEDWTAAAFRPWLHCANLRNLTVISLNVKYLPDDWLAACQKLQHLELMLPNLDGLSLNVLRGAVNLQYISIRMNLKELPVELLQSANNLIFLDLSDNSLEYLPSGVFSKSPYIQQLDLSSNKLNASKCNIQTIATLESLQTLDLSWNPLGSMCDNGSMSVFSQGKYVPFKYLKELKMTHAEITNVCEDWVKWYGLTLLDLSDNSITKLWHSTLWPYSTPVIDLTDNDITTIVYSTDDCEMEVTESPDISVQMEPRGRIKIDSLLTCDCNLYHFAYARRKSPHLHLITYLKCSNGEYLENINPSKLYCNSTPPGNCVHGCTCDWIPDSLRASCDPHFGVRARCDAKALPNLYALESNVTGALESVDPLELKVIGLEDLSVLKLDGKLQKIDLTNNNISNAPPNVSRLLLSRNRKVSLAGNPLNCACDERYLVDELLNHPRQVDDFYEIQCSDKRFLSNLSRDECSRPLGTFSTLGLLAAAAFAACVLIAVLANPELRLRFMIFLYKLGITLPCTPVNEPVNEEEEDKIYDAFISFSHHDGQLVMEEIVPVLEKDYRLCLHYRDWPIGSWIPEQIAASVRDSRRTIIVVSENYVRSNWARAEFREAHAAAMRDAKPRLLAILLQEPAPELDPELKLYLSNNTYLKWGDSAFWDKLAYAMPRKGIKKFIPESP